ncbi:hypothetical protein NDU88_007060 [Pleurodeles waltl]|uniref:Uncharacterized protein n=1 Tax=Pleurodeles waltl TaxID=8319 RepID=A0AAV7PKQ2_PLEWA|nr:hypothetical protein NDU88_007060 [Pleurodeles waltl]
MTQDGGSTRDCSGNITWLNPERGGEDLDSGGIPRRLDRTGGHQETISASGNREKLRQPDGLHQPAPGEAQRRPVIKEAGEESSTYRAWMVTRIGDMERKAPASKREHQRER